MHLQTNVTYINIPQTMKRNQKLPVVFFLIMFAIVLCPSRASAYNIRVLNAVYSSASIEQKCVLIDRQGLLWLGTNSGVKSYDGYRFNTYRSDAQSPSILPNNQVLSMAEDNNSCLWIGTRNGLVCMDKKLGSFTTYHLKGDNQREIYTMFASRDGNIWIGTDEGVTIANSATRTFSQLSGRNTTVVEPDGKRHPLGKVNVKSFVEDKDGSIYIGTWNDGYYRLDRRRHLMYKYNVTTGRSGSEAGAFSLMLDPMGRLWISTWGDGVKLATSPRNQKNPGIINLYNGNKETSINYRLLYDPMTNTVWTCSRYGVGVIDCNDISRGFTYYNNIGDIEKYDIENVTDICTDGRGNIWVQCISNGLYHINTKASLFSLLPVIPQNSMSTRVKSVYSADGNNFWLSLAPCGIATYNRQTGHVAMNTAIPALANIPYDVLNTHFSSIARRGDELWMANNGHGIIVLKGGKAELKNAGNCQYVKDHFVKALMCTRKGVMFIGERHHLSYLLPSGQSHTICGDVDVVGISEDHQGNVWVATENKGIIRISGNLQNTHALKYTYFSPENGNYAVNDAIYCKEDSRHRLWAISNSGGLFLLENGKFNNFNDELHWDIERVFSIIEDNLGRLWLTTDNALVCLTYSGKGKAQYATYTNENGLGKVSFMSSSCLKQGDNVYFGSGRNLITFNTRQVNGKEMSPVKSIIVTDLIIDDKRYSELDSVMRRKLGKYTPQYMHKITIPASVNKFSVEFALLSYVNTSECKYAYKLEGYDKDWHYVDADLRQATFENIPSGSYKLRIKAADSFGRWAEMPYGISVRVQPAWYASWGACILYVLMLIGLAYLSILWYRERLRTKNRLQMQVVFTNIIHELLTPLTVISASADSIGHDHPDMKTHVSLIHNNINRLTRMLRQILEVRKAQAGMLKLQVGEGCLGDFCRETCMSLVPIFTQKEITFNQNITCLGEKAWFDSDKVEKILYNLLSNAVKYSNNGGRVDVSVAISGNTAEIKVEDNGIGMSKEKLKHLYNRFLDGDYRKMNVMGTGIGLSLVNDLVKLHHGRIDCHSKEGQGTTFTVTFPIDKGSYSEEEISKNSVIVVPTTDINSPMDEADLETATEKAEKDGEKDYTILVVEDNTELLTLMKNILSGHFNVKTAVNGEKAQRIIEKTALDVVVTDVMMPVMNGIELTRWIKNSSDYSQLPVIMLTAKTQDDERNEGYTAGADDYITKPFNLNDLLIRINSIIVNRERARRKFETQTEYKIEEQHYSSPEKVFLESVIAKIKEHIADSDYGREELAADLCISSSSLYNKLRAITGQNITSFITSIRLKEACRILRMEPAIRISELSYRVGFSTPRYFSQCFKKEFGMLVKEYVEKNIQQTE